MPTAQQIHAASLAAGQKIVAAKLAAARAVKPTAEMRQAHFLADGQAQIRAKLAAASVQRAFPGIDTAGIVRAAAREAVAGVKRLRTKRQAAAAKPPVRVSLARRTAPAPVGAPSRGTMHRFCCSPIFG